MPFHDFPHSIHWKHSFKTALAAGVTLYLGGALRLPEPHWACLSAILVMQSEHGATSTESRNRLIGTAVGAVLGLLAVILSDHYAAYTWLLYTTTIWLGMLFTGALDLHGSGRFAGVAATVVFLIPSPLRHSTVALHRFTEVSFGIVVAYVVSRLFWPRTGARDDTAMANIARDNMARRDSNAPGPLYRAQSCEGLTMRNPTAVRKCSDSIIV